jgi:hypothetical protein
MYKINNPTALLIDTFAWTTDLCVVECFDNLRQCGFWEHDFRHLMFWTILSLALVLQFGQA